MACFREWKVLEKGCCSWKVLKVSYTQVKDMKCMAKSKKNYHLDIESNCKTVNVNFIALEKLILSWKSRGNLFQRKGTNPENTKTLTCCN